MERSDSIRPYTVHIDDIPNAGLVPAHTLVSGNIGAKIAYGIDASIIFATRDPDYHSRPHIHDAEQINYCLEGEIYVFIGMTGVHAKKGDIVRIPRNVVHWSWVAGDGPCSIIEIHTPSLIGDPGVIEKSVSLLGAEEDASQIRYVHTEWVDYPHVAEVERAVRGHAAIDRAG